MAFSKSTPFDVYESYSKLIREDCELEMQITKKEFNPNVRKTGDNILSPTFPSDRHAHFKWQIDFYPLGYDERSSGYSSIFVYLIWKKVKTATPAIMRFEIKSPNNIIIASINLDRTYEGEDTYEWGTPKLWKVNYVKPKFLVIRAQISAYYEANSNLTSNFLSERALLHDYSSLLESGEFSDVEICAGSKQPERYKAHRAILASRSKVFATMLSSTMKEGQTGRIEINDLSSSAIQGMLKFIYSCDIDFTNLKMTLELLEASEKYDIRDLKPQCAEYLSTILNENNIATILEYAERYGLTDLKKSALEYIKKNKGKFSNKKQYQMILNKNPELILEIMEKLSIHNEKANTETDFGNNNEWDDNEWSDNGWDNNEWSDNGWDNNEWRIGEWRDDGRRYGCW